MRRLRRLLAAVSILSPIACLGVANEPEVIDGAELTPAQREPCVRLCGDARACNGGVHVDDCHSTCFVVVEGCLEAGVEDAVERLGSCTDESESQCIDMIGCAFFLALDCSVEV